MLLRGCTGNGTLVSFSLKDGPILATAILIALTAIRNSDLIRIKTITRGDEQTNVFEGDMVYDGDELLGHVVYSKGFIMQTLDGDVKNIPTGEHISVKEGNVVSIKIATSSPVRSPLLFGYQGSSLSLGSIISSNGEYLNITGYRGLINPSDLQFFTGIALDSGRSLFFGDTYQGGTVVIHNYMPSIQLSSGECTELKL